MTFRLVNYVKHLAFSIFHYTHHFLLYLIINKMCFVFQLFSHFLFQLYNMIAEERS